MGLPRWHKVVRNPPASEGHKRPGVDPWWGRSPGAGNNSPLQCSCLESPMDRGPGGLRCRGCREWDVPEWLSSSSSSGRRVVNKAECTAPNSNLSKRKANETIGIGHFLFKIKAASLISLQLLQKLTKKGKFRQYAKI